MKKNLNPILGLIVFTALTVIVARTLSKAETKRAMPGSSSAMPAQTTTGTMPAPPAATLSDIQRTFGFVPHFLSDIPAVALPGVWEEMKTLQLNNKTALPAKMKELIGLGVAAQIPCQYCIIAHSEFARMNGATEAELAEAVAMASLTRELSTLLNGMKVDPDLFKADVARIVKGSQASATPR